MPTIAIIGRTNVGKSTLFNRLLEANKAMVSTVPGTTRDRNYGEMFWRGAKFMLVDTGGLDINSKSLFSKSKQKQLLSEVTDEELNKSILHQAQLALEEADLIFFVLDSQVGVMPQDRNISSSLLKGKKNIILVANKSESPSDRNNAYKFKNLGLGEPQVISAKSGKGIGELLERAYNALETKLVFEPVGAHVPDIKVAIVGVPNVGKSSLVNSLIGEKRMVESPIAHTTREPQDITFQYKDKKIIFIDTAGLRRHHKIKDELIKKGLKLTAERLQEADVILFVVEAHENLTGRERHIADQILENKANVIVVANKWDLIAEKTPVSQNKYKDYFYEQMPFMTWVPITFVSAQTGQHVAKILDLILEVEQEARKEIPPGELKAFLKKVIGRRPPLQRGAEHPFIYKLEQVNIHPPRFNLIINQKDRLDVSYVRYIANRLRESYGFKGVPIKIELVNKWRDHVQNQK